MKRVFLSACVASVCVFCTGPSATAGPIPAFQGLGDLSGGDIFSEALDVSEDGTVVVGRSISASGMEAFRWSASGGMIGLGDLLGGNFNSRANGVSADGSVIVGRGSTNSQGNGEAFRWESGVMTGLGNGTRRADDVSADGTVIVGRGTVASGSEAFRWESGQVIGLGDLSANISVASIGHAVSGDGSVVVGAANSLLLDSEAFRWQNGVMSGLGDLDGGGFFSSAFGISDNGLVIVGEGTSASGVGAAFRWENGTMISIGHLPGTSPGSWSRANAASGDGSLVVGKANIGGDGIGEAFLWDGNNGMRSLQGVLTNDFNLDLTGWSLSEAKGISPNGNFIVGWGFNPSGDMESWIATIPEPATLSLVAFGGLALLRRRRACRK